MANKTEQAYQLENEYARFSLSVADNSWSLADLRANVDWGNQNDASPWVEIRKTCDEEAESVPLFLSEITKTDDALSCSFVDESGNNGQLKLAFYLIGDALQVYAIPEDGLGYAAIDLFNAGLAGSAEEEGEVLIPTRMGLLLPANGRENLDLDLGTYEYAGAHAAMAGLFKSGAVLLVDWGDPYISLGVTRTVDEADATISIRLSLSRTARSFELHCLGKGDLSTLAEAYRARVTELGYRVTWEEKLKERPQAARLFGTCNVKLWFALRRRIDEDMVEQSAEVLWTFDEVAQIAEHLKNDLELDDVFFHLGGWTRYGYDCRHPDIRPANPECGGNEGLTDCINRVKACGYLFCLHDNYQDMYRDAPSWDEYWLQKEADGSPTVGGVWLGGQAFYTCAREAIRLAQRPDNLPWVQATFKPDVYFIDTTYAVGPQECFDPRHPLTKQDDIHWKVKLSDYARDLMGMFGSEDGREWAVPHADVFEGLASVAGEYLRRINIEEVDGYPVPFFDMVFHDCIALYGKYRYEPETMAEQVINHVSMGRTLYYHALGNHLYWQDPEGMAEAPAPDGPVDSAMYTRANNGWAEGLCLWDRYMKNTQEVLGPLNKLTSEALIANYDFLEAGRKVRKTTFSNGATAIVNGGVEDYTVTTASGAEAVLPAYGFLIEAGTFTAFVVRAWEGRTYDAPVLFTLTSLDGQDVGTTENFRIFHGFGDSHLVWQGSEYDVVREEIIS
jgi:hypothetical protein